MWENRYLCPMKNNKLTKKPYIRSSQEKKKKEDIKLVDEREHI